MGSIPKPAQLPETVDSSPGAVTISHEELDVACSTLGLVHFRPKTIKALKVLGKALDPEEIARIQSANVIIIQDRLNKLLNKCEEVMDSAELEETVVDAIRAATAVCAESNRSSELIVKMLQEKLLHKDERPVKFAGFRPGDVVVPLQINIQSDGKKEKESVAAE